MNIDDRIIYKLDMIDERIRDLCERITKTETQLDNHFKIIDDKEKTKEKKFYYIIALLTVGFTLEQIVTRFLF